MANRKATFAKRQRETDLKSHAKAKEERRIARNGQVRVGKGPEIAWDQAVYATNSDDATPSTDTDAPAIAPVTPPHVSPWSAEANKASDDK